jgi:hypothetical protein
MGVVGARHTHPRLKGPNFPGQRLAFLLSDFQEDVIAGFAVAEAFFLPKRRQGFKLTNPTTGFNHQCQLLRLRLLLTTSLVSVAAAAARFVAFARPSGERATHSAASSAVAK